MNTYKCIHCKGVCEINIIKDTEKATEPKIEFCPFCGMSNKDKRNWKATKFIIIYHRSLILNSIVFVYNIL